jgi:hypothetical protein
MANKKTVDPWDLLREMLGSFKEIVSDLEEEECLADCPPEWARCAVCRSRLEARYAVRQLEGALEAHSKETVE